MNSRSIIVILLTVFHQAYFLTPRPRGIFIQVSSVDTHYLNIWIENICKRNAELGSGYDMIYLVLVDVATITTNGSYEMRYDVLDIIAPYFPSGSKQCFGNVFAGTVFIPYSTSDLYREGIHDVNFRKKNVEYSKSVAENFLRRYPNTKVSHWYVTYEANLNYLVDLRVKNAYKEYLTELVQVLQKLRGGSVMWSPVFWNTWDSVSDANKTALQRNLRDLFTTVQANASPGVNWMNLQDFVGRYNQYCGWQSTPQDAVKWFNFLKETFNFPSLQLNMELFELTADCSAIVDSSAEKQMRREQIYAANSIPMGAVFEIRYWRERWGNY